MMSNHFSGHQRRQRVLVAAAATASVLWAVSAPVAAASPGGGSGGHPPKPPHPPTVSQTKPVSAVQPATTATKTVKLPTPLSADPNVGLNIGNLPPGMPEGTGNTNYANQSNPASVQFYNLGANNDAVANNVGTVPTSATSSGGPGWNFVNLGNANSNSGNQTVNGAGNFGINTVSAGNFSGGSGNNMVNVSASSTSTGMFGSNLAFLGNDNKLTGLNEVDGSNSIGINMASVGSGNGDFSAVNLVEGILGPAFGANYASVGNNNGQGSLADVGVNSVDNTGGAGTFTAGVNYASVGDNALDSGFNLVQGANTFGTNFAVVMSTATNPTIGSGNNTVFNDDGVFGTNFAFVGAGNNGSGNNTATATSGGFNFAIIAPGQTVAEGDNTGGGINIAILPTATAPGNCAAALCINLFGLNL